MGTLSLADLGKSKKLHLGLPEQEERVKFKEEVVLGQGGVYLSYLSDFFDIVYQIDKTKDSTGDKLGGVGVPEVEQRLEIAEPIPSEMIHRMVAWYRHVNEQFGTEATMQVFYDKTEGELDFPQEMQDKYPGAIKRDGKFVYVIPEQNVTGGFVSFGGNSFPKELNKELYEWALSNYEPILNIHSHNSMGAFWSGIDDSNELPLYSRLCLVVGRVHTDHPEFRFSWNFEGKRHHFENTIDSFIKPLEIKTTVVGMDYEETSEKGFKESLGYLDHDKLPFDERWDDQIYARGRFGGNRGKFKQLTELDKKDYEVTPKDNVQISKQVQGGSYLKDDSFGEDGEELVDDETGLTLEEMHDQMLQDKFYGEGIEVNDDEEDDEDTSLEAKGREFDDNDAWKQPLLDYKFKGSGTEDNGDDDQKGNIVGFEGGGFRHTFRNPKGKSHKQSKKPKNGYDRYKQNRLNMNKGKDDDTNDQSSIWDDVRE